MKVFIFTFLLFISLHGISMCMGADVNSSGGFPASVPHSSSITQDKAETGVSKNIAEESKDKKPSSTISNLRKSLVLDKSQNVHQNKTDYLSSPMLPTENMKGSKYGNSDIIFQENGVCKCWYRVHEIYQIYKVRDCECPKGDANLTNTPSDKIQNTNGPENTLNSINKDIKHNFTTLSGQSKVLSQSEDDKSQDPIEKNRFKDDLKESMGEPLLTSSLTLEPDPNKRTSQSHVSSTESYSNPGVLGISTVGTNTISTMSYTYGSSPSDHMNLVSKLPEEEVAPHMKPTHATSPEEHTKRKRIHQHSEEANYHIQTIKRESHEKASVVVVIVFALIVMVTVILTTIFTFTKVRYNSSKYIGHTRLATEDYEDESDLTEFNRVTFDRNAHRSSERLFVP